MVKHLVSYILIALCMTFATIQPSVASQNKNIDKALCTFKGLPLHGRVQIVHSFPDIKVKFISSFADLHVQRVSFSPDSCGKFEIVNSFPNVKIQLVSSFPDITISYVNAFPGVQ